MLETGDIVQIVGSGSSILYVVCGMKDGKVGIARVRREKGFPLFGSRDIKLGPESVMKKVGHEPAYEGTTFDSIFRKKMEIRNAGNMDGLSLPYWNKGEPMPEDIKKEFVELCSALSPENLTCDGQLSNAQIFFRRKNLLHRWATNERKFGKKVDQDLFESLFYSF